MHSAPHGAVDRSPSSSRHDTAGLTASLAYVCLARVHAAELQCLLANLIYRKYIKGYIAFKQRVVVLAKTDAFPSLATVQLGDPFNS